MAIDSMTWSFKNASRLMLVSMLLATTLWAQLPVGTILGQVTDPTGAAVPGAEVTIRNVDTGQTRTVVTDGQGEYRAPSLATGHYEFKVEHAGFSTETSKGLTLEVAQEAVMNFILKVGATKEEVIITGEAQTINTTNASLGQTVNAAKIADMPLNGRNYIDLTTMLPGVSVAANANTDAYANGNRGTFISVDGGTTRSNNFLLDGTNIVTSRGTSPAGGGSGTTLGIGGIKEFKVLTGTYGAEYGFASASQTTIVTKNGTDRYHGEMFEYLRNSVFDAANYFDVPIAANNFKRLPSFKRNNFGADTGGPIRTDKTFFYAGFEDVLQDLGQTIVDNVPAAGCHPPVGSSGYVITNTVCPQLGGTTSVAVPAVMVPLINVYPMPNFGTTANPEYTFPAPALNRTTWGMMRVDQTFSNKDSMFGRLWITDGNILLATTNGVGVANGVGWSQFKQNSAGRDTYLTLAETHIFSPSWLNTANASYARDMGWDYNDFIGGESQWISPQLSFVTGDFMGTLAVGGLSTFGPSVNFPRLLGVNAISLSDDVFHEAGRHSIKFGATGSLWNLPFSTVSKYVGLVSWSNMASFLDGQYATESGVVPGGIPGRYWRYYSYGFYFQDDWRLTRRMTVNLGMRYEFVTQPNETSGIQAGLIHIATDATLTHGPQVAPFTKTAFSPRVGLAWDVFGDGKTALRAGFGQYYDTGNIFQILENSTQGEPPYNTLEIQSGNGAVITMPLTFSPSAYEIPSLQLNNYYLDTPYLLKWDVGLQRALPFETSLQVAYVGSRGVHLDENGDTNQILPVTFVNKVPWWAVAAGTNPRLNPNFGANAGIASSGDSKYSAMDVVFEKRVQHGLQFAANYTLSHLGDDTADQVPNSSCQSAYMNSPITFADVHLSWGPGCWDIRNNLRFDALYYLPNIKGSGVVAHILNKWWMGAIWGDQTGTPFSPTLSASRSGAQQAGNDTLDLGTSNQTVTIGGNTVNFVPFNKKTVITHNPAQWFNPLMFQLQPVVTTPGGSTLCTSMANTCYSRIGNVPRGLLRGPGYDNVDFNLTKDTHARFLGEGGDIEFRAEFFNILNHPAFQMPNGTIESGAISNSTFGPYTQVPNSTAGQITTTVNTSREIQFSLKAMF